ncbi:MAG: PAC2 family protein, partial [Actinomycetota bacterium]
MALYRLHEPGEPLVAPAIVAAFDGWIDAGGASTAAADHIAAGAEPFVTFDSDLLYDYRSRRPVLDIVDGTLTELTWPHLTMKRARVGRRDLVVLTGPEPDFRWRELGRDVREVASRFGVLEWVSLGAIPAAVPHTRTVPILATASKPGLLHEDEQQGPQGLLRVPSAALSTIELEMSSSIPTVGFYAQVPHYVGGSYPAATIA